MTGWGLPCLLLRRFLLLAIPNAELSHQALQVLDVFSFQVREDPYRDAGGKNKD